MIRTLATMSLEHDVTLERTAPMASPLRLLRRAANPLPGIIHDDNCAGGMLIRRAPTTGRLLLFVYVGFDVFGRPVPHELTDASPVEHWQQFGRCFAELPVSASWWSRNRSAGEGSLVTAAPVQPINVLEFRG
jgi:hypothetical protein